MKIHNRLRVFSAARSNIWPRVVFGALAICCLALIAAQISSPQTTRGLRGVLTDTVAPVFSVLSALTQNVTDTFENIDSFATIREENARLREENAQLKTWEQMGQKLTEENRALRKSLHVATDLPASFITARIISDTSGGYVQSIVVNAGTDQGVKKGQIAMADGNFIGRVLEAGEQSSRILLLHDFASRIPVIAGDASEQGILSGDNDPLLHLLYTAQPQAIHPGDAVLTSGKGGGIPPGLPVGKIDRWDGTLFRVIPNVDIGDLRYVQIADYGLTPLLERFKDSPYRSGAR